MMCLLVVLKSTSSLAGSNSNENNVFPRRVVLNLVFTNHLCYFSGLLYARTPNHHHCVQVNGGDTSQCEAGIEGTERV